MALKKMQSPVIFYKFSLPGGFSYGFSDEIRFKIHPFGGKAGSKLKVPAGRRSGPQEAIKRISDMGNLQGMMFGLVNIY